MGEVVRLVSGAELGIHADWQAVGGREGWRGHPRKALFSTLQGDSVERGFRGTTGVPWGKPSFQL